MIRHPGDASIFKIRITGQDIHIAFLEPISGKYQITDNDIIITITIDITCSIHCLTGNSPAAGGPICLLCH